MHALEEIFAGLAKLLSESPEFGSVLKAVGIIETLDWLSTHPWVAITAVAVVAVGIATLLANKAAH